VSPGFEAIWGVPVSEAYGNPRAWMERVHPDDRHAARTARGPGRECAPMQYRIVRPDGQVRWISDRAFPVYDDDGRLFRLAGVAEDVTERRRVEQALYESEERYRAILRHYPDSAVFLFDQELRFLVAEGEALAAAGNDPSRVVGRRLRECVPPAMADALEPMYRAALRGEERTFPLTLGEREYDCRALPLRDADGQVIAGLVVARDVSEQRRHDAVRQALEAQLRQSQKMEAVGRLAGGIAHDFNNILTVITANAEFLLEALDPADPRHADTVEIRAAAARAAALTRQLLAFSRKQILSPQVLDLNRVVEAVRPMLARLIGEDVRVETRAAPELPAVLADAGQMEQVLLNLAVNARDAMPGGGRLCIETAECRVDDGTWADAAPDDPRREVPPGAYVTLAMSDTGTGMPPEVAARVFEPFFTTKPLGRGTGLGLSTVYGIVTQSGGHVCVHSVPGEGSTFTLFLPRVSSAPCAAAAAPAAPAPARGSESVLLVEDEEVVRALARRTLERQGYTVIEALGAEHALAVAAAHDGPIHLLLTDVVMPEMAGPALVERLHGERPLLPVLYMSGYTDDDIVRHGVLTSETPFLQKPFTPAALVSAVREVLDRAA
jgi:PAS domain S-box-containing protein